MATQDDLVPQSSPAAAPPAAGELEIHKLHMNAIGIVGLVAGAASAVAPLAAMFFSAEIMEGSQTFAAPQAQHGFGVLVTLTYTDRLTF